MAMAVQHVSKSLPGVRDTEILVALPRELGRGHFSFFIFHLSSFMSS